MQQQARIFSEVYDEKNKMICSKCDRNYTLKDGKISEAGCCTNCAIHYGHFFGNNERTKGSLLRAIMDIYNFTGDGFFNKELQTCILPRELRSSLCLSWKCISIQLSSREQNLTYNASVILTRIKKENLKI